MAFEFLFASLGDTSHDSLRQGDLLIKNADLKEVIGQAHSYYANESDYTHFMVLTQSCDLVSRDSRRPKSPYISLAAVRPLHVLVDRLIAKHRYDLSTFPVPICQRSQQLILSQLIERLLHNTESGYFFLRKDSHPNVTEDLCAFLPLSIAIRISHYETCVKAKIAQLKDVFQAKVGWLTGNLYSQVATPDFEEFEADPDEYKRKFNEEILFKKTAWLTSAQLHDLKKRIKEWERANPGRELDPKTAKVMIGNIPDHLDLIVKRAIEHLANGNFIERDDDVRRRASNALRNDLAFKRLIRDHHMDI